MNSEKVKKIKKVLEQNTNTCLLYDFEKNTEFKIFQCQYILDYINELESENERLRTENVNYYGAREQTIEDLSEIINKQKDRIAELEKGNKENNSYAKGYADGIKNTYEVVVPDKLKQFAERLKENFAYDIERCKKVDETLKEFVGK